MRCLFCCGCVLLGRLRPSPVPVAVPPLVPPSVPAETPLLVCHWQSSPWSLGHSSSVKSSSLCSMAVTSWCSSVAKIARRTFWRLTIVARAQELKLPGGGAQVARTELLLTVSCASHLVASASCALVTAVDLRHCHAPTEQAAFARLCPFATVFSFFLSGGVWVL